MKKILLTILGILMLLPVFSKELEMRDGLPNFFNALNNRRSVCVAYFGGSITAAGDGWREQSWNWMRVNYPETIITHVNAGIGGTGSDLGVFRVESDVIAHKPDLVFVEFAVNDGGREVQSTVKTMEGIVRKIWKALPYTDICIVYTTDEGKFSDYMSGKYANSVIAMEQVADFYGIPSINFADRLVPLFHEGKLVFTAPKERNKDNIVFTTDRVHPLSESGHPLYAATVADCILEMEGKGTPAPHILSVPLDKDNWNRANKVSLSKVRMDGWEVVSSGKLFDSYSKMMKSFYRGVPGSKLHFNFKGTALGLYDFLGPKSTKIKVTVDGESKILTRFDRHCSYDRLANTIVFAELKDEVHSVTLEVLPDEIDKLSILSEPNKAIYRSRPNLFKGQEYFIGDFLVVGEFIREDYSVIESMFQKADNLWRSGHLEQAEIAYAELTQNPDVPQIHEASVWLRLAEVKLAQGNMAECKNTLAEMKRKVEFIPTYQQLEVSQLEMLAEGCEVDYRHKIEEHSKVAAAIYVNQSSPKSSGTKECPFVSIEEAIEEATRLLADVSLPEGAVEIILTGERYQVTETVNLDGKNSGTKRNPIIIRSEDPKSPVLLTGGINVAEWKVETDSEVLSLLPENARGQVLVADFAENGINGIDRIVFGGFGSGRSHCGTYKFDTMPVPELFYDGTVQELSRWPNLRDTVAYVYSFSGERPKKWADEDDVWLHGYWKYLYADSYEKVGGYENGRLVLLPPYNRYGFNDVTRGFMTETRWYALNLLSEMDRRGEWKISADRKKMWFFPPKKFNPEKCVLSTYGPVFVMTGCDYVTIRDVEMSHVKGDGVIAKECSNLTFYNCNIHDLSGLGIQILGGKCHTLHSIRIQSMGRGGIYLQSGDKVTLEPSESLVENCYISNLSRIDRTYTPAVLIDGVGITVQNCKFEYIPSSAIRLEGNDMLIQLNEFGHCVRESNDQGAIDIWFNSLFRGNVIRWNYFHDLGSKDRMVGAVRMDDAISGTYITENIMKNSATHLFGAVQIHGGNYNIVDGNVFVDNNAAISNTLWPDEYWPNHFKNDRTVKLLSKTRWKSGLWTRYPELKHLYDNPNTNFIRDNKFINCNELYMRNSLNENANKIEKVEFFNNMEMKVKRIPLSLRSMASYTDPWHFIPTDQIGTYE